LSKKPVGQSKKVIRLFKKSNGALVNQHLYIDNALIIGGGNSENFY